jgi:hypothetical protein
MVRNLVVLGVGLTVFVLAAPQGAHSDEPAPLPACVKAWPEVRYRPFGYDHVVHIRNDCDRTADCTVTTDVNPDATRVSIPPGEEAEVVTWMGSPSREFTPTVACHLQ